MKISENSNINDIANIGSPQYQESSNIAVPKGANEAKIKAGKISTSVINKLHLIKLADNFPYRDSDINLDRSKFQARTVSDLCQLGADNNAVQYDVDDFLYCKNVGQPINRLITLRRFPYPCTDNLWDKESQGEPDIARMITYSNQEVNKLEELLAFSYKMKWKELTAEFEQASMQGEQSGLSGMMKSAMKVFDPNLYNNDLMGENARMLDPKFDQNKVYGPVDSITNTHIRDIGLEFDKEFEITFDYELRSINGRTPEYAMKDLIANILACTYNDGKFWPGARYWVGDRPSKFYQRYQYMNTTDMDNILYQGFSDLKSALGNFGSASSAIDTLKKAMRGGAALALGKILDKVGRPGILTMNSLLSGEPTGMWHLMIGNPYNPTLCVGNLICEGTDISFPTDSLSYGDFPTKLQVKVKLKPAQSKDRAGVEMMFNMGKQRIYYAPKTVDVVQNQGNIAKHTRGFFGFDTREIDNMLSQTYSFIAEGVNSVKETVQEVTTNLEKTGDTTDPNSTKADTLAENTETQAVTPEPEMTEAQKKAKAREEWSANKAKERQEWAKKYKADQAAASTPT